MMKYLKIVGFKYVESIKAYIVYGLPYRNNDDKVKGFQPIEKWVNANNFVFNETMLNKDMYCQFDDRGRILECEVK